MPADHENSEEKPPEQHGSLRMFKAKRCRVPQVEDSSPKHLFTFVCIPGPGMSYFNWSGILTLHSLVVKRNTFLARYGKSAIAKFVLTGNSVWSGVDLMMLAPVTG